LNLEIFEVNLVKKNRVYYNVDPGDGISSWYECFVTKQKENDLQMEVTYSEIDQEWTVGTRGETAMKIRDHGNGIELSFQNSPGQGKKKWATIDLGYDALSLLGCFLDYYQTECDEIHGWEDGLNDQKIKKMRTVKVV